MRFLNRKEKQALTEEIWNNWNARIELEEVLSSTSGRYWLVTRQAAQTSTKRMKVESVGNYFARRDKNGVLRLSIEGSQILGKTAKRNVLEISEKDVHYWLRGQNIDRKTSMKNYVILKYGKDFVGCGKAYEKGILNHVPKERRIKNL